MSPIIRGNAAVAALLLALTLSGCTKEDEPEPAPGHTPAAGDVTPPGTTLEFGQTAIVKRSGSKGRLKVTVQDFEKGRPADLESIDLADERTPYYARVRVEPLDAQSMEFSLSDYLFAFAGDRALTHLSIFGEFPRCQDLSLTSADPTGAYESCLTWLAEPGTPAPDSVTFDNDEDYGGASGAQVTWE